MPFKIPHTSMLFSEELRKTMDGSSSDIYKKSLIFPADMDESVTMVSSLVAFPQQEENNFLKKSTI